jgi:hypothetical protein
VPCFFHAVAGVNWSLLPLPVLRAMCPGQDDMLDIFPESWTAADVSNLMLTRPEWGMFVGMFGSIWKSVCEACQHSAASSLLATISSRSFASVARDDKSLTGMPLIPAQVLRLCGFEGFCDSLRRKCTCVATAKHHKPSTTKNARAASPGRVRHMSPWVAEGERSIVTETDRPLRGG